ncbi:hypothetical protein [Novosphingobium sp. Rr 2-17]|uniref:hypothetical protein n=1 Tax=Novosphingobium sp. Rr 2-17 TaxID=555793 RepID=UPI0012F65D9F|nr:hypothetical protein [Novosphingobium sp. Rr 2-17]
MLEIYARQRPYVRESLEIIFFCADAQRAAAEVSGTFRCIKDCDDTSIFGQTLRVGEAQRTNGFLIYKLNNRGELER